ncbi:LLM class F420-dependent oxidoreductase [Mycolicibacterium austroafricanum]|uniref:LLM class F420-dependent oxidoreductase n=1 Tax=Mycolicibacterium austroafricanum TaxID=39687 RepID=UPI001CA3697A|nr:LLM class F420-dependent oxidoreductase [Mycolicibacterium austroafricanum]QZT65151.1 LLM class F420-dependent oxidoreductase [Mycolicibacterium austroafricanum]
MLIGLSTPVVVQTPAMANHWEGGADIEDIARIAEVADSLGFDYLTCSEHVAVPVDETGLRGAVYWDPLATLGFLAARTSRIRLATSVLVLGYHHPLEIAKRYGTLDRISGGRLVLGVGVGSLRAEFEMLSAPWADRGVRADDAIRALRSSLSVSAPSYHGEFYRYQAMMVEPHAVQPRVPIWVGGRTARSLRRAVGLADGWMPFGLTPARIAEMLAAVDIPDDFDIVLAAGPLDPRTRDECLNRLRALRDVGATAVTCSLSASSAEHYCDQLASLRDLVDEL